MPLHHSSNGGGIKSCVYRNRIWIKQKTLASLPIELAGQAKNFITRAYITGFVRIQFLFPLIMQQQALNKLDKCYLTIYFIVL